MSQVAMVSVVIPSPSVDQVLAVVGSMAIWPVSLILLVPVALALIPRDQRVAGLRALAELVRAVRGRADPGSAAGPDVGVESPAGTVPDEPGIPDEKVPGPRSGVRLHQPDAHSCDIPSLPSQKAADRRAPAR